jgi:hypothetical protein
MPRVRKKLAAGFPAWRREFKNPAGRARPLPNVPGAAMRSASECDRWGKCSGGLDVAIGDAVRGGLRAFDLVGRSGLKHVKLYRLVHSYSDRFHVSKRRETANTLIDIENYPFVSLFHDFTTWLVGNFNSQFWRCLALFKLRRPFHQKLWNGETPADFNCKYRDLSVSPFHRALKQPETATVPDHGALQWANAEDRSFDGGILSRDLEARRFCRLCWRR